jgi:hypothetical protein
VALFYTLCKSIEIFNTIIHRARKLAMGVAKIKFD